MIDIFNKIVKFFFIKISRIIFLITPEEFKNKQTKNLKSKLRENLIDETFKNFNKHIKKSLIFTDNWKTREYGIKTALQDDIDEKYMDAQRKARERGRVGQRKYGGAPDRASSGVGERPGDERTASLHNRQRGYKKRKPMGYGGSAGNRGRYGFKDQFIPAGSGKNESYEMGTDEYRKHTQEITPGQEIQDYGRFKVQSMKEALAKVWGLDESESSVKKEKKDLTKELKGGKTLTGKESDTVDVEPKLEKKK